MNMIKLIADNHAVATGWTVAVYDRDRHYGGPEEGGWWYDSRELIAIVPADSEEAAEMAVKELEAGEYRKTGDRYSVNYRGTGDYALYVIEPGDEIIYQDPTERPHYE